MFTSFNLFNSFRAKPEKKPLIPAGYPCSLLDLANKPHSYELFDTLNEEKLARASLEIEEKKETIAEEKKSEDYSYFLFGCHGSLKQAQFDVANGMKAFLASNGFSEEQKILKKEQKSLNKDFKSSFSPPIRTLPCDKHTMPSFAIVTGDNLYTDGASSPNDVAFKNGFHDVYDQSLIYLLVLGNHDCERHKLSTITNKNRALSKNEGISIGANEVAHTYLNSQGQFDQAKYDYLNQPYISLEKLAELKCQWFMPSRFYEVTYKNTTFLMLDSNHIAIDFLEYHDLLAKLKQAKTELDQESIKLVESAIDSVEQTQADKAIQGLHKEIEKLTYAIENNQAYWLEQAFIRHPNTRKVLNWHHPVFTPSKRSDPAHNDTLQYLREEEVKALEKLGISTTNFSTILKDILVRLKIPETVEQLLLRDNQDPFDQSVINGIDEINCAHEHMQLISNDKLENETGAFQFIAGGGGGSAEKHPIRQYDNIKNILFNESYGFGFVTLNSNPEEKIYAEIFSTNGQYGCFTNKNLEPVFDLSYLKPSTDKKVYKPVRALLLEACYQFLNKFNPLQNSAKTDVEFTLSLIKELNNPRPTSLTTLFDKLLNLPPETGLMPFVEGKMEEIIKCMMSEGVSLPTFVCHFYESDTTQKELRFIEKSSYSPLKLRISPTEFHSTSNSDVPYLRHSF
ncbi:MAG: hypothetical protein JO131_00460 [Gammaproteobacteria bacterium]|nr:hypothetical protein [Gammaproteobacteria bacterium]